MVFLFATACQPEVREISYKTPFDGLKGAERQGQPIAPKQGATSLTLESVPDDQLITTDVKGNKTLILQSPRHVVVQLRTLLVAPEPVAEEGAPPIPESARPEALIYAQLISDATKKRLIQEGRDPTEAIDFLKENQQEILALLAAMPMGELSTDVSFEPGDPIRGQETYRLRVRASRARMLDFDSLWITRENGKFKFLWVN